MNDRYLYRAKRMDNGEWTYGYLYGIWERKYILWGMTNNVPDMTEVEPSTICQCTGLKDKNGKLIWENDIVQRDIFGNEKIGIVTWMDVFIIGFQFKVENKDGGTNFYPMSRGMRDDDVGERCNDDVIGNIFDNPELLEVGE